MTKVEESATSAPDPDNAWGQSLRDVFREVIEKLPDHATLGELIDAARHNAHMAPVLDIFTVQELIDLAKRRPRPSESNARNGRVKPGEVRFDTEGNPLLDLEADNSPAVIRRRADVPDGDMRVLRVLMDQGPVREGDLMNLASLTSEQIRLILRNLRGKGFIHQEGSGPKRRLKITRHGSAYLRKMRRSPTH